MPALGSLITRIPASVAQAMLAGIVVQLCLGSVTGMAANPWAVGPVVLVWVLALRLAPRWASPLAFVAAAVVIAAHLARSGAHVDTASLVPRLELTAPTLTLGGLVGIALPLYLVTMASQNVPGVAVMRGFGYEVPWRRSMLVTGAGTVLGAPAGGHAINLAAISAALAAGPDAGEDRSRRWIASVIGIASAAFATLVSLAPKGWWRPWRGWRSWARSRPPCAPRWRSRASRCRRSSPSPSRRRAPPSPGSARPSGPSWPGSCCALCCTGRPEPP